MTVRSVSRKSENSANLTKAPISSPAARRLCKAALKRHGSLRKAAKALGLKSYGQLYQIMNGRMRDTAEMKAALRRADRRAKRAWELIRDESPEPRLDVEAVRGAIQSAEHALKLARELLKVNGSYAFEDHVGQWLAIPLEKSNESSERDAASACLGTPSSDGVAEQLQPGG